MSYDLFKAETSVIAEGKKRLEEGNFANEEDEAQFKKLLKSYEKLFKTTRRLVKLSDRNEAELNATAGKLDEQNKKLEGLSEQLSKYLSPQVYESIFKGNQKVSLNTARKKLTVFFSDIKDFTATTEKLQPEDLTYLLNKYFTEMSKIALEHGATIDKFIGDAMLMFFGDPETMGVKEDALACVKMAMDMQRKMADLQSIWKEKGYEKPFSMRIGINTGYCNVGNFGSDARMDYTIIGGEVNLAARLEAQAEPNGIMMSYETYALVREMVSAEALEPIRVKGISREVRPYAVRGIYDETGSGDRFVRKEHNGMLLLLDMDMLKEGDKQAAVAELKSVIEKLSILSNF